MATALTKIEPIPLPDRRRPAQMPSLPAWAERSTRAVRLELQRTEGGKFEDVLILPPELVPNETQRQIIQGHISNLRSFLRDTPANSDAAETRVAAAVSKLLTVLAGEKKSDVIEQGRSEVYLEVLDDVPCWAVEAAARLWFKHDAGLDERGKAHNYVYAPDPGTLRKIAQREVHAMGGRVRELQRVLYAREFVDCSASLEKGRAALLGLNKALQAGDMDKARALTFDAAVSLGSEVAEP